MNTSISSIPTKLIGSLLGILCLAGATATAGDPDPQPTDLAVTAIEFVGDAPTVAGEAFTLQVTVTNHGPVASEGGALHFFAHKPTWASPADAADADVTKAIGPLGVGESAVFVADLTAPAEAGWYHARGYLIPDGPDYNTGNHQQALVYSVAAAPGPDPSLRVSDGLVALYTFLEGEGNEVLDQIGNTHLAILDTEDADWIEGGGLSFGGTIARTDGAATDLIAVLQASNAMTVEAWVVPASEVQDGIMGRIVTLSPSAASRNFTLGQDADMYGMWLSTDDAATDHQGRPQLLTPPGAPQIELQHVVYTRDSAGEEALYVDAILVASGTRAGNLSNWGDFEFGLGNEPTLDRPWMGNMFLVAIYDRALSVGEVEHNLGAGLPEPAPVERVTAGLEALYTFFEGEGDTVFDQIGNTDLTIQDTGAAKWIEGGGLSFAGTIAQSDGPATSLVDALKATDELTVELWISPTTTDQNGPARIATLSDGLYARNFTVGHGTHGGADDLYSARLRTQGGNVNGTPELLTPVGSLKSELQHVVFTRASDGSEAFYLDGILVASGVRAGDFSNWSDFKFGLGDEIGGNREWLGNMFLAAVYSRALDQAEIEQNYEAGVPVLPSEPEPDPEPTDLAVTAIEFVGVAPTITGEAFALQVTVTNHGPAASAGGALHFFAHQPTWATPDDVADADVTKSIGPLGVGDSAVFVADLTAPAEAGWYHTRGYLIPAVPDVNTGNDQQAMVYDVAEAADPDPDPDPDPSDPTDLAVTAIEFVGGAPTQTGEAFTLQVTVTNHGPAASAGGALHFFAHQPTWASPSDAADADVTKAIGPLGVGESAVFEAGLTAPAEAGWYHARGYLIPDGPDYNTGNHQQALVYSVAAAPEPDPSLRVSDGLVALYTFLEGEGDTVFDQIGNTDLTIQDAKGAEWITGGGLSFGGTMARTAGAATDLIAVVQASNAMTVEAWVVPANTTQSGPARIVTLSSGTSNRNFTLGQQGTAYDMRVRTSVLTPQSDKNNGLPSLQTPSGTVETELQHVVYTRDSTGDEALYVDGVLVASDTRGGDLSDWSDYAFGLGNETSGDREWLGYMFLAAVYDRALSVEEVGQNYDVGVPAAEPDPDPDPAEPTDLAVTAIEFVGDAPTQTDEAFTLQVTVTNHGPAASTGGELHFFAHQPTWATPDDVADADVTKSIGPLGVGDSAVFVADLTVPAEAGWYHARGYLIPAVPDVNTGNDQQAMVYDVAEAADPDPDPDPDPSDPTDLAVTAIEFVGGAPTQTGEAFTLQVTVTNHGPAASEGGALHFFAHKPTWASPADAADADETEAIGPLGVGESVVLVADLTAPAEAGWYHARGYLIPAVPDVNTGNDQQALVYNVAAAADPDPDPDPDPAGPVDLAVTGIEFIGPAPTVTGEAFTVQVTVANVGTTSSTGGTLYFFANKPGWAAPADGALADISVAVEPLGVGENAVYQAGLEAPAARGWYHTRAFLVANETDSNTGNNQSALVYGVNLIVLDIAGEPEDGIVLTWNNYWGDVYTVYRKTDESGVFEPIAVGLPSARPDEFNVYTDYDAPTDEGVVTYKVGIGTP